MKKRFLTAAVIGCMMVAGVATGCGSKTADAPTTAATEAVTTEAATAEEGSSEAESTEDAAEVPMESIQDAATLVEAASDYLAWSGKEWNAATEEEKMAAAKAYLIETVKITAEAAGQEYTSEMEASITDDQVKTTYDSLAAGFTQDESITIQQLLDAAAELMNTMMTAEAEAEGAAAAAE